MGAPHTQNSLVCSGYSPFSGFSYPVRKMADQIDAVTVGTPDHSHFPITMGGHGTWKACVRGETHGPYIQWSGTHDERGEEYGVVTQMGNQGHRKLTTSSLKLERGWYYKDVTANKPHTWIIPPLAWMGPEYQSFPPGQPGTFHVDWETWLGVVKHHDYHPDFINGQWRAGMILEWVH